MGPVVLSGFPGTGKSTIGPLVASRLGGRWIDTDAELIRRTGIPTAELWKSRGEAHFRELEEALIRELLAQPAESIRAVISLGGGSVTVRATRHLLLDRAFLVTLTTEPSTLLRRLGDLRTRPHLLATDPLARITTLLAERAHLYAESHLRLATDDLDPESAADRIVAAAARGNRVTVALGTRSYAVDVVADEPLSLGSAVASLSPSSLVVVTDENVLAARNEALSAALARLELPIAQVTLPPGEVHKTLTSVERIWTAAIGQVDRDAVVLGFGGGVVGDLAGFAASTMLRGVRVVQAPTSLLAMVDASVGGKTGFDLAAGKNLVGTFHQPSAVVIDLAHLKTLPRADFLSGLAEVAKTALACDPALWAFLDANAESLAAGVPASLRAAVRESIGLKARIVRDDETDTGQRALLNLGHTIAHALETVGGYSRYRHGEAVALGLVLEARAAERLGIAPAGLADHVARVLRRLELPTEASPEDLALAIPLIARDKKRAGADVRIPLPTGLGVAAVKAVSVRDLALALAGTPER